MRHRRPAGQALAEFAIVVPVLIALLGGVIQFGLIFWAQNTLTQVVRDTGRWAATEQACWVPGDANPLPSGSTTPVDVAAEANAIAETSSLIGYSPGEWTVLQDFTDDASPPDIGPDSAIAAAPSAEGIYVAWVDDAQPSTGPAQSCPPSTNAAVWHVTVRIDHAVPVFLPGLQYLPGLGTCTASGCHVMLSSSAQYRMEPSPLGMRLKGGSRARWPG